VGKEKEKGKGRGKENRGEERGKERGRQRRHGCWRMDAPRVVPPSHQILATPLPIHRPITVSTVSDDELH